MKYIKTFELNRREYNVDDYVKIERASEDGTTFAKIKFKDNSNLPYFCVFPTNYGVWTSLIKRKMTKKEIDQYNLDCYAKKYNL